MVLRFTGTLDEIRLYYRFQDIPQRRAEQFRDSQRKMAMAISIAIDFAAAEKRPLAGSW
jgi:hypothetical protein